MSQIKNNKNFVVSTFLWPFSFVLLLILIHILSVNGFIDYRKWALFPKSLEGVSGIITAHFVHSDWTHLFNNSLPLLVLGMGVFYFYRKVSFKIYIFSMLISGFWVWIFARPAYHLGASGIVYALAAFLFTSGIIKRYPRMYALSLLVVFLYGGLVWGIFPIDYQISWESHLMGMLAGIMLAFYYKNEGPQKPTYSWELEDDDAMDEIDTNLNSNQGEGFSATNKLPSKEFDTKYVYTIKKKKESD